MKSLRLFERLLIFYVTLAQGLYCGWRLMQYNMSLARYLLLVLLLVASASITVNHSPVSRKIQTPYTFVGAGGNNVAEVLLACTPANRPYSVVMIVKPTNAVQTLDSLDDYAHYSPTQSNNMDLQSANIGGTQIVKLGTLSAGNSVYINTISLQPVSFTCTITVTEATGINSLCNIAIATPLPSTTYCQTCNNPSKYGAYCLLSDYKLSNNNTVNFIINSATYTPFTIPSTSNKVTLTYAANSNNYEVFIQFKQYNREIAGYINYVQSSSGSGRFSNHYAATTYQVDIASGGAEIAIGVVNLNAGSSIIFSIAYTETTTTNVLAIVLGVLGGLLFIALIVVACFIARRMRNPEQVVHPRSSIQLQLQSAPNSLSPQQIETFFPSVSCHNIFPEQQVSSNNLMQQNKNIDRDCVICLCPVTANDLMKVTFCRHIFHGTCLTEWFKKQRNCPYCREEYSKSATMEHYQAVLTASGKNFLAGVELVTQIFRTKQVKSGVHIEDVKDE